MARTILVNREADHNKYWIVDRDPTNQNVVLVWNGRLGSPKGAAQPPRDEGGQYAADRYTRTKIDEKLRKGYRKVSEREFKQLAIQSSVIGLSNKCELMQWVECKGQPVDGVFNYSPVQDDRLQQPDYDPALLVHLVTKKTYAGQHSFRLLFTPDKSYEVINYAGCTHSGGRSYHEFELREIVAADALYDISGKVEAGIAAVFN